MKINTRFLLFLLGSIAAYALALHALRGGAERIAAMLLNVELREVGTHLQQIVELERAPMEKGVYDYTYWDDMVAFARRPLPQWAAENIEATFPNFGVQYAWVYDADLGLVYAMPAAEADAVRLDPAELRGVLAAGWFGHFYARPGGADPVEYFTAPIQPSADRARSSTPRGFLVGARRLDRAYTQRIGAITGSAISIEPWAADAPPANRADTRSGSIDVFLPLIDRAGTPIAALRAHQVNEGVQLLRSSLDNYNALYLLFAAVNLGLLALFLFAWVKRPLRRISESLDRHTLEPVAPYLEARHEFGTLARLMRSFFQQRDALVTELEMRKQYEGHLREARDQADRAASAKADFLSVMSHELRTPLNSVIGLASLLLDERPRPDQVENLKSLKFAAENLLVLINDVLDFNRLEAGKLVLETRELDLRELFAALRRTFQPQAEAKGLTLRAEVAPDVPPRLIGDPLRVSQVLGNLLANAIKFTEQGGVTADAAPAGEAGGRVRIAFRVADTGIGIRDEERGQIFELFTRGGLDPSQRYGGTGLGLSIAGKLVEHMGGAIAVESAPGRGTTFSFVLELVRAVPAGAARADAGDGGRPPDVAGRRVLVVEDNPVNRELAVTFLRRWGCAVDVAEHGLAAVEQAAARPYDIILMDLQMPQMSGIEATSRIRRNLRGPNARSLIIAFTATDQTNNLAAVDAAGFDDYIAKPIDPEKLREALARNMAKIAAA